MTLLQTYFNQLIHAAIGAEISNTGGFRISWSDILPSNVSPD